MDSPCPKCGFAGLDINSAGEGLEKKIYLSCHECGRKASAAGMLSEALSHWNIEMRNEQ